MPRVNQLPKLLLISDKCVVLEKNKTSLTSFSDSAIQHLNNRGQCKKIDNKLPLAVKSSFSYSVELTFH